MTNRFDVIGAELLGFAADNLQSGQRQLATTLKQLVSTVESPVVELLDYADDTVFLNPSLFTYFHHRPSRVTLEQILFGSLSDPSRLGKFLAYADCRGFVYLPAMGYLATRSIDTMVSIEADSVFDDFQRLSLIQGTDIELCRGSDPLLEPFFRTSAGSFAEVDFDVQEQQYEPLNAAIVTLRQAAPLLLNCLHRVTRRVVVFRADKLESFATVRSHGTAFLNVAPARQGTAAFFVEDLAHQCGHVLFTAVTLNTADYLVANPEMPLRQLTGDAQEHRDLYTTFHGIFTEAMMCIALQSCLDTDGVSGQGSDELVGRLSFAMKRFQCDLLILRDTDLFTELGQSVIDDCQRVFDDVYRRSHARITSVNLSNQSYAFSYRRFCQINGQHHDRRRWPASSSLSRTAP